MYYKGEKIMILQTLAITQEEITAVVQEFIQQYAPQFEKWAAIIVGVCSALVILMQLITAIVKVVKSKNQLKATVTPLEFKNDIINTMQTNVLDKLQGTFDVDITDKLNPLIQDVVSNTNKDIATINDKIDAIASAEAVLLNVFKSAGSLTQEEYESIKAALDQMPSTQNKTTAPTHVKFALDESKDKTEQKHNIVV